MPCATIHLLIADGLLGDWSERPELAPIDPERPVERRAFLHGSLAPDMGFVPGVDRFVSELAHYVRPAALTRALLAGARDPVDRAFAWGWAAHVVGDAEIHPIVGRAVGERLHGDRARRVDAGEDCATHVSVEVGLDMAFLSRRPEVSVPPRSYHFDRSRVAHLMEALSETYGLAWEATRLLRSHRRAVALTRWWFFALRGLPASVTSTAGGAYPLRRGLLKPVVAAGRRLGSPGSAFRGFLSPGAPERWMVEEVDGLVHSFPQRFRAVVRDGFASWEDRNLETGGPAGSGLGHPASDEAERKLVALGGAPSVSLFLEPGRPLAGREVGPGQSTGRGTRQVNRGSR